MHVLPFFLLVMQNLEREAAKMAKNQNSIWQTNGDIIVDNIHIMTEVTIMN